MEENSKNSKMRKYLLPFLLAGLIGCNKPAENYATVSTANTSAAISDSKVNIASFNIQIFGKAKSEKKNIMDNLVKIVTQKPFNIFAVQEIRDKEGETANNFLKALNSSGHNYKFVMSPRLGRSNSKENYAIFYDPRFAECLGTYTFDDKNDIFEREPFVAYFKSGKFDFVMVDIHTKPKDAKNEINALDAVVRNAIERFNEQDCIVLGDYNSDGSYFNEDGPCKLRNPFYFWIIPNSADTTVAVSKNTYDRMVITKSMVEDYANKWEVHDFMKKLNLTLEQAKKISDHFPISAEFYRERDTD